MEHPTNIQPIHSFVGKHTPITGSMGLARIRGLLGKTTGLCPEEFPFETILATELLGCVGPLLGGFFVRIG